MFLAQGGKRGASEKKVSEVTKEKKSSAILSPHRTGRKHGSMIPNKQRAQFKKDRQKKDR